MPRYKTSHSHLWARSAAHKSSIDQIVRVDHAGEFGAIQIYAGQLAVLKHSSAGHVIAEMGEQEALHKQAFDTLLSTYRTRPTALLPLWRVAGYGLGVCSALLGKEAAMACTVAVETVIGGHYNDQLRDLNAAGLAENEHELLAIIRQFRDEELEHLETGLEHNAPNAPFYSTFSALIDAGCRAAIWISKRF